MRFYDGFVSFFRGEAPHCREVPVIRRAVSIQEMTGKRCFGVKAARAALLNRIKMIVPPIGPGALVGFPVSVAQVERKGFWQVPLLCFY